MARYTVTKTWADDETLRAADLAVEYRAVQASANAVVDINAGATQFASVAIPPRKLARVGSPAVPPLRVRGVIAFAIVNGVQNLLVDAMLVHQDSRILGMSFGCTSNAASGTGIVALDPAQFTRLSYAVIASALEPDEFDAAQNMLVASVDHDAAVGLAIGEARAIGFTTPQIGRRTWLSLWLQVVSPVAAPSYDFGVVVVPTLGAGFV